MRFERRKLAAWLLVIVLAAASVMMIREALAVEEEPLTYSAWVMCQPDSRVNWFFKKFLKLMTKFQPFDLHLLFFLKISRKFV